MELGSPVDMQVRDRFPENDFTLVLHDSGVRTGAFAGLGMAVAFVAWLFVANRVSALDHVALQRNVIAAAILALFFLVPVVRFMWHPGRLLTSSLIAWSIFAATFRALSIHFAALSERYSTMRVFILGAIVCMILATLSWVGTCIWRVRESHLASHRVSHSNHHL